MPRGRSAQPAVIRCSLPPRSRDSQTDHKCRLPNVVVLARRRQAPDVRRRPRRGWEPPRMAAVYVALRSDASDVLFSKCSGLASIQTPRPRRRLTNSKIRKRDRRRAGDAVDGLRTGFAARVVQRPAQRSSDCGRRSNARARGRIGRCIRRAGHAPRIPARRAAATDPHAPRPYRPRTTWPRVERRRSRLPSATPTTNSSAAP